MTKVRIIALIAATILCLGGFSYCGIKQQQKIQELSSTVETLEQSNAEQIAGKKLEIQQYNEKLGLAESRIISKDSLIKKYEKQLADAALLKPTKKIKGSKNVSPIVADEAVIVVDGKDNNGIQSTAEDKNVIAYNWEDSSGRFKLVDPDIKKSGNEQFSYKLKLKISGFLLSDDKGKIQARQVIAQEQITKDGKTTLGQPLEIESNIIEYIPEPHKNKKVTDIFHPRAYALFDTTLQPGLGVELINIGNVVDFVNVGIGPFVSVKTDKFPDKINSSRLGVGVQYSFLDPLISTNIGVGLGVSTPLDNFGGQAIVSGNIIFYLNN